MKDDAIYISKSILNWKYYNHASTFSIFVDLLLKANTEEVKKNSRIIKRGQLIIDINNRPSMATLSAQQFRKSINNLKSDGKIKVEFLSPLMIITIIDYEFYANSTMQEFQKYSDK